MSAINFPRKNNPHYPLPPDYWELDEKGQRMARVNACSLGGTPELEVVSWHFFRENYLKPCGFWYKGEMFVESPDAHYTWVRDWNSYDMLVHLAPRGGCKSTVNMEDILKKMVTRPHWECALFLATQAFVTQRLGTLMAQIEHNSHIIDDFGQLKAKKGSGVWNRGSCMELTNGSKTFGFPIKGASLGTRPSGLIVLDDVEKSDDQIVTPSDLREGMEDFFFNALYPMARNPAYRIPVRVVGTLYNRRMFIYWLYKTQDTRVLKYFKRILMTVHDMSTDEFMNEEWIEEEKERLGPSAFSAQCLNAPTTKNDRILSIHPELNTYWLEDVDDAAYNDPFNSNAIVVTHTLSGVRKSADGDDLPIPQIQHRSWAETVSGMRRFITVDSSRTTSPTSDYSVVHVMGFENSPEHRDTLYSLDMFIGRVRSEELLRQIYKLAIKWNVDLVGVEAYPILAEFYERVRDNLPEMYGQNERIPRVIPLKFPTKVKKEDKIMQMEWRFRHYRVKLPVDRRPLPAYTQLFYQIENFTEDMALLEFDDAIDSLTMHQMIGKQHRSAGPDIYKPVNLIEEMKKGEVEHLGIPLMSGINAADLKDEDFYALMNAKYDQAEEEYGPSEEWWMDWIPLESQQQYNLP
jgi:hypothetical protein